MENNIYLVCQTQPLADYINYPIYALTDKDKAIEYARDLNKKYAKGVKLSDKNDFLFILEDALELENYHYYEVIILKINEKLII